ncbi:MAG: polymerase, partial [Betaproteobacteria bacterium]
MQSTLALAPLLLGALLAAGLTWLGMAAALQKTSHQHHGYLHWVTPILLLVMAAGVWLSGRDLTTNFLLPEFAPDPPRPALLNLLQPLLSLLLLAVSGERILSHFLLRGRTAASSPLLPMSFVLFWLGSTASPALLGAHPTWSHDLIYPLIMGLAATVAGRSELELALRASRNALLVLMLAGLCLMALLP